MIHTDKHLRATGAAAEFTLTLFGAVVVAIHTSLELRADAMIVAVLLWDEYFFQYL